MDNELVVGRMVRLAVERHVRDEQRSDVYLDWDRADQVIDFFRMLKLDSGAFVGQVFDPLPWQVFVLVSIYAWRRKDGRRRFRQGYISMAKKNGKTTLASGMGLLGIMGDDERRAEVYSAAADREQAGLIFKEAHSLVQASAGFGDFLDVVPSRKRIVHHESGSFYQALSADVPTKEGINAHYVLFDELHAQRTRDLFDTLRYAGSARRQPLFLSLTTAGWDRHSICYEQYDLARAILEQRMDDDTFFAFIAEAEKDDDWSDPDVWRYANPSFDTIFDEDTFKSELAEAQRSATKENTFRRYRLNQWTEQSVRWIRKDDWDLCAGRHWKDLREQMKGKQCWAGLDLAVSKDLNAFVLLFKDGDRLVLVPFFWCPGDSIRERSRRDGVSYDVWAREGLIETTEGNVADYHAIRRRINQSAKDYRITKIAVDRLFQGVQLCTELEHEDGHDVVPYGQGYVSMNASSQQFERLILNQTIEHGGHPILTWMAGNVVVETDPTMGVKPSKKKSTERIDGIVAAIMALGICMLQTNPQSPSVMEW